MAVSGLASGMLKVEQAISAETSSSSPPYSAEANRFVLVRSWRHLREQCL